jgi:hypothetical protein
MELQELSQDKNLTAAQLRVKYKYYCDGEHHTFTKADWRDCVLEHKTLLGYWDWVGTSIHAALKG